MKQLSIMVDMDRCIGCKTCIVACRNHNGLVDHESAEPGKMSNYVRIESRFKGTFPDLAEDFWPVMCQQCRKMPCAKACESGAISRDAQTGIVLVDKDKCNGSRKCIDACPYKTMQFDEQGGFAHKCTMCMDRVVHGQDPVCVETCLADAMSFGEKEILLMQAEAAGKEVVKKLSAQSIIYVRSPA